MISIFVVNCVLAYATHAAYTHFTCESNVDFSELYTFYQFFFMLNDDDSNRFNEKFFFIGNCCHIYSNVSNLPVAHVFEDYLFCLFKCAAVITRKKFNRAFDRVSQFQWNKDLKRDCNVTLPIFNNITAIRLFD